MNQKSMFAVISDRIRLGMKSRVPARGRWDHPSSDNYGKRAEATVVYIMGIGKLKPGREKEFEEAVKAYYPQVLEEDGTLEYRILQGTSDSLLFAIYELYKDKSAQEAHMSSPHLQQFMRVINDCREEHALLGTFEEIVSKK
mgnify:CR=1 FL=1